MQCDSSATPSETLQQKTTTRMQFTYNQMMAPVHHTATNAQVWATKPI